MFLKLLLQLVHRFLGQRTHSQILSLHTTSIIKPQLYLTNFMLTGSQNAGLHFDAKFNLSEQIHCFKNTYKFTEFLHSFSVCLFCYSRQCMDKVKYHHYCAVRHVMEKLNILISMIKVKKICPVKT